MSCIYGPRQFGTEDQGWVAHFLIRALRGEPITLYGDGLQVRDVLFVGDLVEAFLLARANVDQLAGRAFNIGGGPGNTTSLLELVDQLGALAGRKPRVAFEGWRTGDQKWYVSDVRAFGAATGWAPCTSLDAGLARLHAWLGSAESGVAEPEAELAGSAGVSHGRGAVREAAVLAATGQGNDRVGPGSRAGSGRGTHPPRRERRVRIQPADVGRARVVHVPHPPGQPRARRVGHGRRVRRGRHRPRDRTARCGPVVRGLRHARRRQGGRRRPAPPRARSARLPRRAARMRAQHFRAGRRPSRTGRCHRRRRLPRRAALPARGQRGRARDRRVASRVLVGRGAPIRCA